MSKFNKFYQYGGVGAAVLASYIAIDKFVLDASPKKTHEIEPIIPAPVYLTEPSARGKDVPGLDPKDFKPLTVGKVEPISDNTAVYKLKLADEKAIPNFPLTSYVVCK